MTTTLETTTQNINGKRRYITKNANDLEVQSQVQQLLATEQYSKKEIAELLQIKRVDLNSIIGKLERAGRAYRLSHSYRWGLTEKGHDLIHAPAGHRSSRPVEAEDNTEDVVGEESSLTPSEQEFRDLSNYIEGYQAATREIRDHFLGSGMATERAIRSTCTRLYMNSKTRLLDEEKARDIK